MYMEKLIEELRHIEIQVVGDSSGKLVIFLKGIVRSSAPSKLTEETPSPFMTSTLRNKWERQQ